jgi:hypothetical protein
MEIKPNDKGFYFDEAKFKWTDEAFLQVLVNIDWDIPNEQRFPIDILIQTWGINSIYSIKGPKAEVEIPQSKLLNPDYNSPH